MKRRTLLALTIPISFAAAADSKTNIRVRVTTHSKGRNAGDTRQGGEIQLLSDEPFAVRALDPFLQIGSVALTNYRFSGDRNQILTFTFLGNEDLRAGASMFLQYGNDRDGRIDLGNFRPSSE